MSVRRSLFPITPLIALAVLTAACSGPDVAAPAAAAPAAATEDIKDGHFVATFGDRSIDVPSRDLCLFGHLTEVGRSLIVNWQDQGPQPLSFTLAMSPPPGAVGVQKIAGFSIGHGHSGNVWMAPEHASLQITEHRRIEGGVVISGTFSGDYPAMVIPGQPVNPPMAVKGGFRNMECMDPAALLPEVPPHVVPNSPLRPPAEASMHGGEDDHH